MRAECSVKNTWTPKLCSPFPEICNASLLRLPTNNDMSDAAGDLTKGMRDTCTPPESRMCRTDEALRCPCHHDVLA
jgi:hypothetical protein